MFTGVGRGARGGRGVAGAGGGRTQRRGAARRPATGGPRLATGLITYSPALALSRRARSVTDVLLFSVDECSTSDL